MRDCILRALDSVSGKDHGPVVVLSDLKGV